MNKKKLIKTLRELTTTSTRKNKDGKEETFYIFNDKVMSKEVKDFLFESDFKIDDYHFNWIDSAFKNIADWIEQRKGKIDLDYYDYNSCQPDCYTSQLTEWLNSRNDRVYYLSEILEEIGIKDGFELLSLAQTKEMDEVYNIAVRVTEYIIENE